MLEVTTSYFVQLNRFTVAETSLEMDISTCYAIYLVPFGEIHTNKINIHVFTDELWISES